MFTRFCLSLQLENNTTLHLLNMVNNFPNSSILTLITQSENGQEKILFLYLKAIPDFFPTNKVYWYEGTGKGGTAKYLWSQLSIKQWAVCGQDADIYQLLETLLITNKLTIGGKEIKFSMPSYTRKSEVNDPFTSRLETKYDRLITVNNAHIPHEFYQKENLHFLSGYKTGSEEIVPIYPAGFFETNFIYDNLKENTWGIIEHRTAYLTFHGVRETSEKGIGSKEMVGFYQENYHEDDTYTAIINNEKGNEIGRNSINKNNGVFKVALSEPTQKGNVHVIANGKEVKTIEYVLIQDIKIEGHLANATYKDLYGRSFMMTSDKKVRPEKIDSFTWQKNVYADVQEANEKLSDLFKQVIDYLGSKILIADPYFINNISIDKTTKAFSLSDCQNAFINALIHSAVEKGIQQINILGCARATNHLDSDETGMLTKLDLTFENYEKLFKNFITGNQLEKYFPTGTVLFWKANEDFHNRYWFSIVEKDGIEILDKCVIFTNSIGNMNELDVIPVLDNGQLRQITRKYTRIFKSAEIRLTV